MHTPVLLHEVLKYLAVAPSDFIIDGTVNGGGHFREILKQLGPQGKALGIDLDREIIDARVKEYESERRAQFVCDTYANVPEILKKNDLPRANGLLLDLGFSSLQLAGSGRGFSFEVDEPLLMTYSDSAKPLKDILPTLSAHQLSEIIFSFSGERYSKKIAEAIVATSKVRRITTSGELARIIASSVPSNYEDHRINPATRTFQALRIYVNGELESVAQALQMIPHVIAPGGRVVIISFHSLEDRLVKHAFAKLSAEGRATILTQKPVEASLAEMTKNPRSRSALLRAIHII